MWDWRKGQSLWEGKGANGEPPQVYGVVWDRFARDCGRFCTFGVKQIKFWERQGAHSWRLFLPSFSFDWLQRPPALLASRAASRIAMRLRRRRGRKMGDPRLLLREVPAHDARQRGVPRALGRPRGRRAHGDGQRGHLRVEGREGAGPPNRRLRPSPPPQVPHGPPAEMAFSRLFPARAQAVAAVQAHEPGPQVAMPNGLPTFGGVRALQLRADGRTLLSVRLFFLSRMVGRRDHGRSCRGR